MCDAGQRGLPPQEGIPNFGKVNDELYRGAQPNAAAFENLQRLGIKSIVCLRSPGGDWKKEQAEAKAHGIICTNLPLSGVRRPKPADIRKILDTMRDLPAPVFVHCQHGCDRTGTIVACYRIEHDKWTNADALREAERFGISKLEKGMKNFIREFKPAATKVTSSSSS